MALVPAAERLIEAREALHRLNTGALVVEVRDQSGESIRYQVSGIKALERYIASLEREVAGKPTIKTIHFRTSKGL